MDNIFIEGKLPRQLTFNPGSTLTGFEQPGPDGTIRPQNSASSISKILVFQRLQSFF